MRYILLLLLICGGCATPITELREQADVCEKETPEQCETLWKEYMQRLEHREKQLAQRNMTCPGGFLKITDSWGNHKCIVRSQAERQIWGRQF